MLKKEMGISGFLLLDKPSGLTSRWALERVQKKLKSQKAGHTGTLDFGVTGLLLIALGEARKTLPLLMNLDKEYEGEMHLHNDVSDDDIKKVFKEFEGKIEQLPPVRSRVARRPRIREIYSLQILGRNKRDVRFMAHCQHGTYIRKLVHDIGERLGCGAHMTKLRRTRISCFSVKDAKTIEKVNESDVMPMERVLKRIGVKSVWIKDSVLEKVRNGNPLLSFMIRKHNDVLEGEKIGIFIGNGNKSKLVAIGLVLKDSKNWTKKRSLVKTDRVLKD